jgi:hypothetical protein
MRELALFVLLIVPANRLLTTSSSSTTRRLEPIRQRHKPAHRADRPALQYGHQQGDRASIDKGTEDKMPEILREH